MCSVKYILHSSELVLYNMLTEKNKYVGDTVVK